MSNITSATQTVQQLTALLGALNPFLAAGLSIGQAVARVFQARGDSAEVAAARAADFEATLRKLEDVSQRVIDVGEARLRELDAQAGPFNGPRENRED